MSSTDTPIATMTAHDMLPEVPRGVLAAYGLETARLTPIFSLVNRTFLAERSNGERFIIQRLHPAFAPEVHHDIAAIVARLLDQGMLSPELVPPLSTASSE